MKHRTTHLIVSVLRDGMEITAKPWIIIAEITNARIMLFVDQFFVITLVNVSVTVFPVNIARSLLLKLKSFESFQNPSLMYQSLFLSV